jgi:hypothetical protein
VRNEPVTAALALLLLVACGGGGGPDDDAARNTTTTRVVTSTTAPDTSALNLGERSETREGNVIQMVAFVQPLRAGVIEPGVGMEFAAVEAEICAGPGGAQRVSPEAIHVELADGTRRGRSFFGPKEPALAETRLAGGDCVRGWVNFEVPEGVRPAYVVFSGSSVVRWTAGGRSG